MGLEDALERIRAKDNASVARQAEKVRLDAQARAEVRALGIEAAASLRSAGVLPQSQRTMRWTLLTQGVSPNCVASVPESWELVPQELYLSAAGEFLTIWRPIKVSMFKTRHELRALVIDSLSGISNPREAPDGFRQSSCYVYEQEPYGTPHQVRVEQWWDYGNPSLEDVVAKALVRLMNSR